MNTLSSSYSTPRYTSNYNIYVSLPENLCTGKFVAVWFIMNKNWKLAKHSSAEGWIINCDILMQWNARKMRGGKDLQPQVTLWMNFIKIMLNNAQERVLSRPKLLKLHISKKGFSSGLAWAGSWEVSSEPLT